MTNPLLDSLAATLPSVAGGACADSVDHAFLSASETAEVELFAKLYPDGVPDGANLMADLITAIRSGTVDLTPTPDQGWYAWQEYALETLLVTDQAEERAKVAFTGTYKLRLVEAFETELTEHRETHEEQADEGEAEDTIATPPPPPNPDFRLEPLATVYVRHARSYVFLEQALDTVLGAGALDQAFAVDASGVTTDTLRTRIRHARDLFFGSYLLACQDIGLRPSLAVAGDPDPSTYATLESQAVTWLQGFPGDPLAAADVRVITPISSLPDHRALYWAVVGVRTTLVAYSFLSGVTNEPVSDPTLTARVPLPTEQFVQVESSDTPLDRDDFRALCDANPTVDGITKALAAR